MAAERAHIPEIQAYPREIGRYEIISTLGVGASSRVYLALQRGARGATRLLAVKRLRAEVTSDARALSTLAADARVALRLGHSNVVRTYEVVAEPSGLFVVLEVLRGLTLAEIFRRLGRERVPLDEHLWILTQVLAALHYTHTLTDVDGTPLTIVHRNLNPSSVFVTYSGEVKLLEFGVVARAVDTQRDLHSVGLMLSEALGEQRRPAKGSADLARITRQALQVDPSQRNSALSMKSSLESYLRASGSPSGAKNVAAFMSAHFHKDLAKFQRTVDSHLHSTSERSRESVAPTSSRTLPSARYEFEAEDDMKTVMFSGAALNPRLRDGRTPKSTRSSRKLVSTLALGAAFLGAFLTAWILTRAYSSRSPAARSGPGVQHAATANAAHLPRKEP